MHSKDYYNVLKIDRSATEDDIKRAYRKRAMEFHPDVNTDKDTEEEFKEKVKALKQERVEWLAQFPKLKKEISEAVSK